MTPAKKAAAPRAPRKLYCSNCGAQVDLAAPPSIVHDDDCTDSSDCSCSTPGGDGGKGSAGATVWCCEECRLMTEGEHMNTPLGVRSFAEVWSWFEDPPPTPEEDGP